MSQLPEIDLISPAFKAHLFPMLAQVRAQDPVYALRRSENGQTTWLITRCEDALTILKDQRFIKDFRRLLTPEQLAQRQGNIFAMLNTHMLSFDLPDHTRLRALVNISFTPRLVEQWRERIQAITDELIDALEQRMVWVSISAWERPWHAWRARLPLVRFSVACLICAWLSRPKNCPGARGFCFSESENCQ